MKRGERRGALPDEEWLWLRDHLYCKSINRLFREYSEVFGSPYSTMDSFRAVLLRNDLFPITEAKPHDLVHNLIKVYYSGSWKWSFRGDEPQQSIIAEPHWLWKWHENSIKCPSGVSFRPFPRKLKEKQFNEQSRDLETD